MKDVPIYYNRRNFLESPGPKNPRHGQGPRRAGQELDAVEIWRLHVALLSTLYSLKFLTYRKHLQLSKR